VSGAGRRGASPLTTALSALALVALLAFAWIVLGPDSAIGLAIATAVVLVGSVVWTVWRARRPPGGGGDAPAEERRVDPRA